MIHIRLNGEQKEFPGEVTVRQALEDLGIREQRIAVEVNRRILRRADWAETSLRDGDVVEVVQFVGGG